MKPEMTKSHAVDPELTRREALALMGAAGVVGLTGCGTGISGDGGSGSGDDNGSDGDDGLPGCVVTPEQTEGPFFVDELLNRSDIRTDPTDGSVQEGVPPRLRIAVSKSSPPKFTSRVPTTSVAHRIRPTLATTSSRRRRCLR